MGEVFTIFLCLAYRGSILSVIWVVILVTTIYYLQGTVFCNGKQWVVYTYSVITVYKILYHMNEHIIPLFTKCVFS